MRCRPVDWLAPTCVLGARASGRSSAGLWALGTVGGRACDRRHVQIVRTRTGSPREPATLPAAVRGSHVVPCARHACPCVELRRGVARRHCCLCPRRGRAHGATRVRASQPASEGARPGQT